ncbi:hypothetical protein Pint_26409 [Pistacia integerrima]|uniref:Uncharacterized protein n=1 Tax=Pistacia integerrima TaxID=434235 RepID=A0ACC0YG18_9ROSI|nr:hypothetical protein Pint_26409 [Pistacia integerrima]
MKLFNHALTLLDCKSRARVEKLLLQASMRVFISSYRCINSRIQNRASWRMILASLKPELLC